jgi:methyl-accepting chemotaxis protein
MGGTNGSERIVDDASDTENTDTEDQRLAGDGGQVEPVEGPDETGVESGSGETRARSETDHELPAGAGDETERPGTQETDSAEQDTLEGRDSTVEDVDISATALLDTLPQPAFVLDQRRRVIGWNREIEVLTGVDREKVLGEQDAQRFFDERRERTLADAVVESPESADLAEDVERSGRDQTAYETELELVNEAGETLYVHSVATPIYQDGEFHGVIQLLQDNTTVIRKREAMADLVEEVVTTAEALEDGTLSARVEYTDDHDVLDEEVLEIVDAINAIADSTETVIKGIAEEIDDVAAAATEIAQATEKVDDEIGDQNASIRQISDEFQDVSATMEEIAATADEVAAAAEQAQSAANNGAQASDSAKSEMESVVSVCDRLVKTVTQLEERMEEIDDVVEVIADVAEETNLLALNANIEAARAGEEGAGFGVVADEVKSLANETRENAEEISQQIDSLKEQTSETVAETETANERVRSASDEIDAVIGSLDEITDVVDEAATGISEVAEANDDQSASIEELTATVQEVSEKADTIESRIGSITSEAIQQRDSVDEVVDLLSELSAAQNVNTARADGGLADRDAPDGE